MTLMAVAERTAREEHAWQVAARVADPEVPVLTIEDLGVLRAVSIDDRDGREHVAVDITPTYSGCPAMDAIRDDVVLALTADGFDDVEVRLVLSPAWTTDWMSDDGKRKLLEYGIAPRRVRPRCAVRRVRCASRSACGARSAVHSTPARYPVSAPPPARPSTSAAHASSPSTISR